LTKSRFFVAFSTVVVEPLVRQKLKFLNNSIKPKKRRQKGQTGAFLPRLFCLCFFLSTCYDSAMSQGPEKIKNISRIYAKTTEFGRVLALSYNIILRLSQNFSFWESYPEFIKKKRAFDRFFQNQSQN
jgi:hypothetical protein